MTTKATSEVLRSAAWAVFPDALMVAGAGAISYGASLIYVPAGWLAAGVFTLAAGILAARTK